MKEGKPSPKGTSQSADDSHITRAEPEWIGKVLSLAERTTENYPMSQQASKRRSDREKA
jgi:hypothetical protein